MCHDKGGTTFGGEEQCHQCSSLRNQRQKRGQTKTDRQEVRLTRADLLDEPTKVSASPAQRCGQLGVIATGGGVRS
jgi:hypothetical protein